MATTSIWPISGDLSSVIKYVSNEDKTVQISPVDYSQEELQSLKDVMDYAVNPDKTESQKFVTGINCEPSIARQQMLITKKRFDKLTRRTAYHGYQSFVPGEATPEVAHEIGVKLAQKLWGNDYQVIVATHLDKAHIHNHFVINSVSFVDGKKFHSSCQSYFGDMRTQSDALCKEYALSVIDNPSPISSTKDYKEWLDDKDDKSTWRGLVREDVDDVLQKSTVWSQFLAGLKEKGYDIKTNVKHIAVRPPGKERYVRLRSLGEEYSEEALRERILSHHQKRTGTPVHDTGHLPPSPEHTNFLSSGNTERSHKPFTNPIPILIYRNRNFSLPRKKPPKRTSFQSLYLRYMLQMGLLKKRSPSTRRTHFLLCEDIRKIEAIQEEFWFIRNKSLRNLPDLSLCRESLQDNILNLQSERKILNTQKKRAPDEVALATLAAQYAEITQQLKKSRKEVRLCDSIEKRSENMTDKLQQIKNTQHDPHKQEMEVKHNDQWR